MPCLIRSARASRAGGDIPLADTAETTHISSLALLKMLIHGRAVGLSLIS